MNILYRNHVTNERSKQPLENMISSYLDDLLNIDNNFFNCMVNRIYPSELQLNKAYVSDTEASFLDLHLSLRMVLSRQKFMVHEMILILIL